MATSFHGFEVKKKIGAGGMSTVYKGIHTTLGYPVAIKILHPGLAGDASFISRFEREAKAASALRSNNIASVIDFGSEDDVYFIAMEFVDGADLGKVIQDMQKQPDAMLRRFPAEIALLILEEVAYGLKEAHSLGIIHRDIKPSNILLNSRGEVKIADFGLARNTSDIARATSQDLTRPGTIVFGTPSYMSPEQAAGKDDIDGRTDIFSLGVMAYQLLTGIKPFQGDSPTEVQEKIINDNPPPLSRDRCPLVTDEIESMVDKMLAKDPAKRYQSMDQLLHVLKECMESIDPSGATIKYHRDYLRRFSGDPLAFSGELRKLNISAHLKSGYHYKKMGQSNIGDAVREFSYVLSLDPANDKAQQAMVELEKAKEESGVHLAVGGGEEDDTGKTLVMPQAGLTAEAIPKKKRTAPKQAAQPARPTGPGRKSPLAGLSRPVLFGGIAGIVVLVIVGVLLLGRGGGTTAKLNVVSTPDRARIWLRPAGQGGFVDTGELTPGELQDLAEGDWEIRLTKPGYTAGERRLALTAGETGRARLTLQPEAAVATGAWVRVESEPPGASVAVRPADGEGEWRTLTGATPLTSDELEPGSWQVRVSQGGFESAEGTMTLSAGDTSSSFMALRRAVVVPELPTATGRIAVSSDPTGAELYLRQGESGRFRLLGTTPRTTGALAEGVWEVRLELDGYKGRSAVVRVQADETRQLELDLEARTPEPRGTGSITLVAYPFADVYLDGELVANEQRRVLIEAPAGVAHTLELRHPQTFGRLVLQNVTLARGDTLNLGRQAFRWGSLKIAANVATYIAIDGVALDRQTPVAVERIAAGEHVLTARRDGYYVQEVRQLGVADPLPPAPGGDGFRIQVVENEELKIRVKLEKTP